MDLTNHYALFQKEPQEKKKKNKVKKRKKYVKTFSNIIFITLCVNSEHIY